MKKILAGLVLSLIFWLFIFFPKSIYASDCSNVNAGGDLSITTACMFAGDINGVDSGTGNTNTAVLSVDMGGSLTIGASQILTMGQLSVNNGNIIIFDGGSLAIGIPIWMTDTDNDGYPDSLTQFSQTNPPVNGKRRNMMISMTIIDSNNNQSCTNNTNPAGSCNFCQNGLIIFQSDGQDIFGECQIFNKCNGIGNCTLHAKRIFLSSKAYSGNLGGLTNADNTCQILANSAHLGGNWKAWLSSSTISVSNRFQQSNLPYLLVDNTTKIADNWTSLTDGNLDSSINKNENGVTIAGNNKVWTNTSANGNITSTNTISTCSNWTFAGGSRNGGYGLNNLFNTSSWTKKSIAACNGNRRLYCFEQ